MANEVMQSLFGLDSASHAESLRQRQAAEDLAFAHLSPKQQVVYGMAQAGRQAGAGLNQLFGYVPPELQRVRSQEEALAEVQQSGIDLNDPEAVYPALAKALASRGLQQQAMMVTMQGQSATDEMRKQKAALAKAQKEAREPQGTEGERAAKTLAKAEAFVRGGGQLSPEEASYVMRLYADARQQKFQTVINPQTGQVITVPVPESAAPVAQLYPGLTQAFFAVPGQPTPVPEITPVQDGAATIMKAPAGWETTIDGKPLEALPPPTAAPQPAAAAPVATPQWKPQQGPAMSVPPVTGQSMLPGGVTMQTLPMTPKQQKEETRADTALAIQLEQLKLQQTEAQRKQAEAAAESAEKKRIKLAAIDNKLATIDNVMSTANQAFANVDWTTAGALGNVLSVLPGTSAYDLDQAVGTIKANLGFAELQKMRDMSPTGGALGQVAVQELDYLQKTISSLAVGQKPATLRANLGKVLQHYSGWRKAMAKYKAEITATPDNNVKPKALNWNQKTKKWE